MNDLGLSLKNWQNFFVIVATSAGALTGLQFVVIALIAQARAAGSRRDIAAFGTPTVIHFCTALLVSAVMTAPWQVSASLGSCIAAFGAVGLAYSIRVVWYARKANYKPDAEDWFWYIALPIVAHVVLMVAGVSMSWTADWTLVAVAVTSLVFLFLGVHNSWDTVTHVAVQHGPKLANGKSQEPANDGQTRTDAASAAADGKTV
jgi:hypothetical protein